MKTESILYSERDFAKGISFTPDGKKIYYLVDSSLVAVNILNNSKAIIFTLPGENLASGKLSPDGTKYCYSIEDGIKKGLWIYHFSSQQHIQMYKKGTEPIWLNDSKILFSRQSELRVYDSNLNEQLLRPKTDKYRIAENYLFTTPSIYDFTLERTNFDTFETESSSFIFRNFVDRVHDFYPLDKEHVFLLCSQGDVFSLNLFSLNTGQIKKIYTLEKELNYSFSFYSVIAVFGDQILIRNGRDVVCLSLKEPQPSATISLLSSTPPSIIGSKVKIFGPKTDPFTLDIAGPDLDRLKGEAVIISQTEATLTQTTDLPVEAGDFLVDLLFDKSPKIIGTIVEEGE